MDTVKHYEERILEKKKEIEAEKKTIEFLKAKSLLIRNREGENLAGANKSEYNLAYSTYDRLVVDCKETLKQLEKELARLIGRYEVEKEMVSLGVIKND